MNAYTLVPKFIFDPEIYLMILTKIAQATKCESVSLSSLLLLNSYYMNEYLDLDLVWRDESNAEKKTRIDERIRSLIDAGIEMVKINSVIQSPVQPVQVVQPSVPQRPRVKNIPLCPDTLDVSDMVAGGAGGEAPIERTLSDMIEEEPVDFSDKFYEKAQKSAGKGTVNRGGFR
jgi:hypothetical protein